MKDKLLCSMAIIGGFSLATNLTYASTPPPPRLNLCYTYYIDAYAGIPQITSTNYPGGNNYNMPSSRLGFGLDIGYKLQPFFAAEMGFNSYYLVANYDVRIYNSANDLAGQARHYSIFGAAKFIMPIQPISVELFAKLGAAAVVQQIFNTNNTAATSIDLSSNSKTAYGPYFGIGASYFFIPGMAGTIQWSRANGNSSTGAATLYAAGLTFSFPA